MANGFAKYVKNTADRAIDKVQSAADNFTSLVGRLQGYAGSVFEVAKNGETFVGITYSAVPTIRASIKTYVGNIQKSLGDLNTVASLSNAFKSTELTKSIASFVKAVDDAAQAYASALLAYSDKMYEYAYGVEGSKAGSITQTEEDLASEVQNNATEMSSSVEAYSEKYVENGAGAVAGAAAAAAGVGAAASGAVDAAVGAASDY